MTPPTSGPSVGVLVWGIDEFEEAEETDSQIIFEPSDFYYRNCEPEEANSWALKIFAFGKGSGIPPLRKRGKSWKMSYQPRQITAGIQGAVIEMEMLHLKTEEVYLGLYIERVVTKFPAPSGWTLSGPGNFTQFQKGHALIATYPRTSIPATGSTPLDYEDQTPAAGIASREKIVKRSRSRTK
jgi:hypothetical protein